MKTQKLLYIVKAKNGFRLIRGLNENVMTEEYVAETNERVLELVKEHLDSLTPTITDSEKIAAVKHEYADCPQE